jgi:tripartite-type tricarboxylate transporter receptor subunit TctC
MNTTVTLRRRDVVTAFAIALAGIAPLHAQDYPNRPINLVVPYPPGGYADSAARVVVPSLEKALRQPVIVINRPGAGGAIGTAAVAQAKPDGYTLLFTISGMVTLPAQAEVTQQKPAFKLEQLKPIARMTADPMAIIVRSDSPYKTLQDMLQAARANPGRLNYASSGNYATVHVPVEMFLHEADVKIQHVPYQGGAPIMVALLGGQVDFTMLPRSSVAGQVKAGKVRILATVGQTPWADYPGVSTTASAGLSFDYVPWTGIFAPVNVPAPVLAVIRDAVRKAVAEPDLAAAVSRMEGRLAYLDADEFKDAVEKEALQLGKTIRRMGKLE